MQCEICKDKQLTTSQERQLKACDRCADTLGLMVMPPVTRPPNACSCGGRKFLRCIPREHSVGGLGYDINRQVSAPMLLTHAATGDKNWLGGRAEPVDPTRGWGALEVFVCYACGKVEWYCSDVADIPVHPHAMTDVVDYDARGPYR